LAIFLVVAVHARRSCTSARTLGHIALKKLGGRAGRGPWRARSVAAIRKTGTPFGADGHEQPHNKPLMRPPLPLPPPPPSSCSSSCSLFPRTAPVLALGLSRAPPINPCARTCHRLQPNHCSRLPRL